MIKTWVCILFYVGWGGSYSPTLATVDNLARLEDCQRVGKVWVKASQNGGSYHCVEVLKTK